MDAKKAYDEIEHQEILELYGERIEKAKETICLPEKERETKTVSLEEMKQTMGWNW